VYDVSFSSFSMIVTDVMHFLVGYFGLFGFSFLFYSVLYPGRL
jgi:hypothetical protein